MVCERLVGAFDGYLAQEAGRDGIQGLVHGDYRLDNMLFGTAGADRALTVVDWQTVSWGPALTDLAYFLGCAAAGAGSPRALRRVAAGLPRGAGAGGAGQPGRRPRRCAPAKLFRRDDGDRLVDARGAHRARRPDVHDDAGTALRPCPGYRRVGDAARRGGAASRCGRRQRTNSPTPATDEPLWSESWYADFVDAAQGLGGWFRIGLIPNQQTAWIHALVCGPDLPTVAGRLRSAAARGPVGGAHRRPSNSATSATAPLQTYRRRPARAGPVISRSVGIVARGAGRRRSRSR